MVGIKKDRMKIKEDIKRVFHFFLSIIAVLAINCKMECINGGETSSILNGLYKLYNSFYAYNFADVFMIVAIYILIRYIEKLEVRYDIWISMLSIILSMLYVISVSYNKYDSVAFIMENSYQIILSGLCICGYYILIYYSLYLILYYIKENRERIISNELNNCLYRHVWLVAFIFIFLSWLPWILMNYPGTSTPDATSQLEQYFSGVINAHHPPLSTYIMGSLIEVGTFVWDANFGFFLYILLHTVLGALIFSYSIKIMYELGMRLKYCFIGIVFYAWLPFWGGTMQGYSKDLLYTEIITLFVILLVDIIVKRQCGKRQCVLLFLVSILASLLRNNGIYAILPTVFVLVLYLKKMERKRMMMIGCSIVVAYMGITKILYPSMGIQEGSIKEALSIPFLQTARYVDMYEGEVTEYEKQVISSVLDYNALETYNPRHADSVKNTYKNDDSKLLEYFKVWFQMLCKHPGCYVSAFLNKGAGYMAPVNVGFPSPIGTEHKEYISGLGIENVFGDKFMKFFVHLEYATMEMPLVKYFCMAGTYTWILLICIMVLVREKLYSKLILLVPAIMNVLVCIASPTWHIRYALPVIAILPLMISWTIYCQKDN